MPNLKDDGFAIYKGLIKANEAKALSIEMKDIIHEYALEVNTTFDRYLYCTGRWVNPSKITRKINEEIDANILSLIENTTKHKFIQKKSNIIVKTKYLTDAVPFHQDISYSFDNPYSISAWLALNDVGSDSGPLQVIPGSHKWKIQPAVDFWSPDFTDDVRVNNYSKMKELCLEAGDIIIFDSRLWHGSKAKMDFSDRFAYVTRWVRLGECFENIPRPKFSLCGMWTANEYTYEILSKKIDILNNSPRTQLIFEANKDTELLQVWRECLSNSKISRAIELNIAARDLENLIILKKACAIHNAGDLAGKIYKNLWDSLLSFLID
ncbi:MAG: phytanoyl-CoA dioxygenase [Rickettsiaceae bacterium]|jgi:ectoine hydroxylase-related dioxygenase (phytanoyl-CoA dioxygenase family)|nr:phytanoyl-CoA dioxygenase [Rickettsiaceae bacterium]